MTLAFLQVKGTNMGGFKSSFEDSEWKSKNSLPGREQNSDRAKLQRLMLGTCSFRRQYLYKYYCICINIEYFAS